MNVTHASLHEDDVIGYFSGNVTDFHALYAHAGEFDERVDIWRRLLERYIDRDGTWLDLGCGTGIFSFYLASLGGEGVGLDGSAQMVAFCERLRLDQRITNVRFTLSTLPNIGADVRPAELVISSSVVEYIDDLEATLAAFSGLVRPGGALIISMPNTFSVSRMYQRAKYRFVGRPEVYRYIKHFSTPRRLQARLRHHGLTLVQSNHYAHGTRVARLCRKLRLPQGCAAELFVAVFVRADNG
jgi:2-polyprenyl-3-methyl-5-hydroxy-6-metoxy-1,4-benzoquinol methylase